LLKIKAKSTEEEIVRDFDETVSLYFRVIDKTGYLQDKSQKL